MLATLTVSVSSDGAIANNNGNLTLREAIAYVNQIDTPGPADAVHIQGPLGLNDIIQFAPALNGATITITGGNLVVTDRVMITGPTGAGNRITIQKGGASTATAGLTFSGFNLSPTGGSVTAQTGVRNLTITGFDTGVRAINLSSNLFNDETALRVIGNSITNANTAISLNNADVPFHIETNLLVGRTTSSGFGIELNGSGQFLPSGQLFTGLPIKPTIGNFDTGAGNAIGNFAVGIFFSFSTFPDLRISGNRIGADLVGPLPNDRGIDMRSSNDGDKVGRIDHNDIVYNLGDGIIAHRVDGLLIENNLIGANGGDGIELGIASGNHTIRNNTFDSNGDNGVDGDGVTIHPLTSGTDARQIEISANDFLGMKSWAQPIDLRNDGRTDNDSNDVDDGINDLQNYPEISSVSFSGGTWHVAVSLDVAGSSESKSFRFEFYRYNAALKNYEFIRSNPVTIPPQMDFAGSFSFANTTELSDGDQIAVLAIAASGTNVIEIDSA